jgi:hypothetical protein
LQAAVGVFLGDGNDQAQVGFDQFFFGLFGFGFAAQDHLQRALQFRQANFAGDFDFAQLRAAGAQFLARFDGGVAPGDVGAASKLSGFALQRLQAFDGGATDAVDQALALERMNSSERASSDISIRVRATRSARASRRAFSISASSRVSPPASAPRDTDCRFVEHLQRFLVLFSIFSSVSSSSSN